MYSNLSREEDERECTRYIGSSIRGLNLDRISFVIETGGDPSSEYDDATLVRSIEQVVEYDPPLLQERDCAHHFLEYSIMQRTSGPVLKKLLELWPVTGQDDWLLDKAICNCESLPDLRQVLEDYNCMLLNQQAREATFSSANNQQQAAPSSSNDQGQGQHKCAWPRCDKTGATKVCGRCKLVEYCDKTHQTKHWSLHRVVCTDAPRHTVPSSSSLEAIQTTINQANPGDVVEIPEGRYESSSETAFLTIDKPIRLLGAGMSKTRIKGTLDVRVPTVSHGSSVLSVCDLGVDGIANVGKTSYKQINFQSVEVRCPPSSRNAAFTVECNGKILLNCCEIIGGSDGLSLLNRATVATVQETDIELAQNRGIFANPSFTIGPNSAVYSCGGYGIKGRSGWNEKGENQIQPGPWNEHGGAAAEMPFMW